MLEDIIRNAEALYRDLDAYNLTDCYAQAGRDAQCAGNGAE